jgi:copper transport protein
MKAGLALLTGLLLCSQAAWGHASPLAASPAPGAVLEQAPSEIVLTFNEPVSITGLKLISPQGQPVSTGRPVEQDAKVRLPLTGSRAAGSRPQGTFLLSWRVVSADGHPVGGTLDYSVGAPSAQGPATVPAVARDIAIWLTRWLTYLCLFAATGAALFRSIHVRTLQAWARPFVAAGLVLLPIDLGLQGLDLRDVPWTALAQADTWSAALGSTYAATLALYALALLSAAGMLGARRPLPARLLGIASLILTGLGAAASGHAGTAPPQWLSRPAVTLHVMTAIAWIGLLVPLARTLLPQPAQPPSATPADRAASTMPLAGFSRWITPVVGLLAVSGLSLAYLQLDKPDDLWQTHYGWVLIAKLCLVGLLLCLAAYNRWHLTRPILSGSQRAARHLRIAIAVELALALLILAVVSLWRFTPPPRSLDAGRAMISAVTLADNKVQAQVNPGPGAWHIRLSNPAAGSFPAQAVTLILSNPAAGIEPMRRKASRQADGLWLAPVPALPETGKWEIQVEILIDDFDQVTLKAAPTATGEATQPQAPARSGMPDRMSDMPGMSMPGANAR